MRYQWMNLSRDQRDALLAHRKELRRPWHRPPHFGDGAIHYHLTAACYQHHSIIGHGADRMARFSEALLSALPVKPRAWCVLPNHYHLLLRCDDLKALLGELGKLHGRSSFVWNGEENQRGRKVWYSVSDRAMRGDRHFWATVNYIHHNPVKHGYCGKWTDWPYSSAADYLEEVGRDEAAERWKDYPVLDYGKGWDD